MIYYALIIPVLFLMALIFVKTSESPDERILAWIGRELFSLT